MSRSHATELSGLLSRSLLTWVITGLTLTLMAPQPARADWTFPGAQYSCNTHNNSFEVIPYEPTSEAGANPNYRSEGAYINDPEDPGSRRQDLLAGVTALHVAAENGYMSICKLLLDHGADPRLARSDGELPADIARGQRPPRHRRPD